MPNPLPKKIKLAPGAERSLSVTLKSLRNPPFDIALKSQLPTTSILDLKSEITSQTSIPTDKLRILYKKKPVPDSKILKDLVGEDENKVEFSVMVLGGAASVKKGDEEVIPPVAQGASGVETLGAEEFWGDLRGFLVQRLRDEAEAENVFSVFKKAWERQK
jgi:ubiquitin-like protein 4